MTNLLYAVLTIVCEISQEIILEDIYCLTPIQVPKHLKGVVRPIQVKVVQTWTSLIFLFPAAIFVEIARTRTGFAVKLISLGRETTFKARVDKHLRIWTQYLALGSPIIVLLNREGDSNTTFGNILAFE